MWQLWPLFDSFYSPSVCTASCNFTDCLQSYDRCAVAEHLSNAMECAHADAVLLMLVVYVVLFPRQHCDQFNV